jgi:hypothetical protein
MPHASLFLALEWFLVIHEGVAETGQNSDAPRVACDGTHHEGGFVVMRRKQYIRASALTGVSWVVLQRGLNVFETHAMCPPQTYD